MLSISPDLTSSITKLSQVQGFNLFDSACLKHINKIIGYFIEILNKLLIKIGKIEKIQIFLINFY